MPKKRNTTESEESRFIERVKKLTIKALFSDDMLLNRLVLKGGNAIDLVLKISSRASVDIDASMPDDFTKEEMPQVGDRVEQTLAAMFAPERLVPIDVQFAPAPAVVTPDLADFWGGYRVTFKLIRRDRFDRLRGNPEMLRQNAVLIGASSRLQIDISKFEFCQPSQAHDLDGVRIFAYTPAMLASEKLRAICQQTDEYGYIVRRMARPAAPRARDFVDINVLMRHFGFDLAEPEHWPLIRAMFHAKRVPLELLGKVRDYREFHRADFQAVIDSAKPGVRLNEFDGYFDDVVRLCDRLEPLWHP